MYPRTCTNDLAFYNKTLMKEGSLEKYTLYIKHQKHHVTSEPLNISSSSSHTCSELNWTAVKSGQMQCAVSQVMAAGDSLSLTKSDTTSSGMFGQLGKRRVKECLAVCCPVLPRLLCTCAMFWWCLQRALQDKSCPKEFTCFNTWLIVL